MLVTYKSCDTTFVDLWTDFPLHLYRFLGSVIANWYDTLAHKINWLQLSPRLTFWDYNTNLSDVCGVKQSLIANCN